MTTHSLDDLLACLGRVAEREEARAHAAFVAKHGREYDGGSDDDWDELDKDYVGVEEAMNLARAVHQIKSTVEFLAV